MAMIKRTHLVDLPALENYIYRCQDPDQGGIGDRPGNTVDVFHTFFGCASLSIIDSQRHGLALIDPIFAIPVSTIKEKLPHLKGYLSS